MLYATFCEDNSLECILLSDCSVLFTEYVWTLQSTVYYENLRRKGNILSSQKTPKNQLWGKSVHIDPDLVVISGNLHKLLLYSVCDFLQYEAYM